MVLLDLTLPKLDGVEVMGELVKIRPDVKIVLSSGNRVEIRGDGPRPVRLLPKPYSPSDLTEAVRVALEQAGFGPYGARR